MVNRLRARLSGSSFLCAKQGVDVGAKNLTGMRFSRLTAVSAFTDPSGRRKWVCVCDCGGVAEVVTNKLTSGHTTSCGCRKLETSADNCFKHGFKAKHGLTKTPTHSSWSSMHSRCKGTSNKGRYLAAGITVCERWGEFENFLMDMGERPYGTTLDRIDVYGGYSKDNCRWASHVVQQRNKTNTRYVRVNGEKMPLMNLADKLGIKKSEAQSFFSMLKKLNASGLSVEVVYGMD